MRRRPYEYRRGIIEEGLPILVSCTPDECDGLLDFVYHRGDFIRVVHYEDVRRKSSLYQQLVAKVNEHDLNFLLGIKLMQYAVERNDSLLYEQSYEFLSEFRWGKNPDIRLNDGTGSHRVSDPEEIKKTIAMANKLSAMHPAQHGQTDIMVATNRLLLNSKVIYWQRFKKKPGHSGWDAVDARGPHHLEMGIFCPDARSAVAALIMLGPVKICPYCKSIFLPQRPDQNFCCGEHRDAHRKKRFYLKNKKPGAKRGRPVRRGQIRPIIG